MMIPNNVRPWERAHARDEEAIGFVYLTRTDDGMWYIGKKLYYRFKKGGTKPVGNSDWEKYYGSSKRLKEDVAAGVGITRTILMDCYSKSELSYVELKLQMHFDASFDDKSYNGMLNIRLSRIKLQENFAQKYAEAQQLTASLLKGV